MDLCHRGLKKGVNENLRPSMAICTRQFCTISRFCCPPSGVLQKIGVSGVNLPPGTMSNHTPGCPPIPPPPPALSYSYSEQVKESSSWSLSLLLDDDEALELSTSTVGVAVSILFFLLSEPRLTMSRVFTSVEDFGTCFGLG